jgi:hypothetical protein
VIQSISSPQSERWERRLSAVTLTFSKGSKKTHAEVLATTIEEIPLAEQNKRNGGINDTKNKRGDTKKE